eukprot:460461-Rhodomonas_salina.1
MTPEGSVDSDALYAEEEEACDGHRYQQRQPPRTPIPALSTGLLVGRATGCLVAAYISSVPVIS